MVCRHTRHKSMADTERERFVREATEAHERLRAYATRDLSEKVTYFKEPPNLCWVALG